MGSDGSSIGQLASATGLAEKTIRYYEQVGVLPAPRRNAAGYRQYARGDVHRTLFIRRARALGLPLSSLKTLTADLNGRPSRALRPRLERLVTEHLRAVRDQDLLGRADDTARAQHVRAQCATQLR